jgi:regulator of replication initiation timing
MGDDDEQFIENSLIISSEALIQPWQAVKKKLEYMLTSNITLKMKKSRSRGSLGNDLNSDEERPSYPLSIPHGFQLIESIDHPSANASIKSMLYMPGFGLRNQYATMDGNHVHLWTETNLTLKLPIKKPRNNEKASPITAITQWEFAAKWRLIIISTSLLELKTLTSDFNLTSVKSSIKPVLKYVFLLSIDFIDRIFTN